MRFLLNDDQEAFRSSLEALLTSSDPVSAARAWAAGDATAGLKLWSRLAEQGVNALVAPEDRGGLGATCVELVVALEAIGRYGVPGPWVESAAYLPVAVGDPEAVAALAEGAVGTVAAPPDVPFAVDADVADQIWLTTGGRLFSGAEVGAAKQSVDRTRRLFPLTGGSPAPAGDLDRAYDLAVLACAAQLRGAGERLLAETVAYAKARRQFGREIGSYQAIKHQLADVRIALDFARPLLNGAALADGTADFARDVSAAKVACSDAAYRASRVALQVHGAVGYTQELDLSLWITKVRALVSAWGTVAAHRGRILASLVPSAAEGA